MTYTDATPDSNVSHAALHPLFQSNRIQLGTRQRRRLEWLVARCGAPMVWDKRAATAGKAGLIIVLEPPAGPSAELFSDSLHPGSVVAIPFGENPAFDFLKSKLTDFGTVGASGADGPHELSWGGRCWRHV